MSNSQTIFELGTHLERIISLTQMCGGSVFYVSNNSTVFPNAVATTSTNQPNNLPQRGKTPSTPLNSIDYAVGLCTAGRGDLIVVLPGHSELVPSAGALDLDVAGITIIGIGRGTSQPKISFTTATTADMDIDAANITIIGMHFVAGFADVAAAIDVNKTDFSLIGCRFSQSAVDLNVKIWVQDAADAESDRITIRDCHCIAYDAANTHFVNFAGTGTGHIVTGNILIGDWGTACIGGAGVVTRATVMDNHISNAATDVDSCINFASTATGICHRNLVASGAAQANQITATAMSVNLNYGAVVSEDLSGVLEPATT